MQKSTDLFFYLYNSILIVGVFFTSMNSTVLIPESMRIRALEGEAAGMRFLNFFIYLYCLFAVVAISILALNPASFFSVVSNFGDSDLQRYRFLLYLSLPLFGMICIINLLIDILTSHKFFTVPMFVGIINGSISILFVTAFHEQFGIASVFYGLLLSYAMNLLILLSLMKASLSWDFFHVRIVREKRIWNNFGFAQLGNVTSTLSSYTPMYILSGFNTGIITALTFAQQISSLPTMLITYQFSSVAGIKFNELYVRKETHEMNRVFSESANFLHFVLIPLSCFVFYYSPDIVRFLLGFTSMNEAASGYVGLFLKYLGFLMPLYVINTLISRLFMASHKIRQSFWYQVVFNVFLISGLFYAVKHFGPVGYPITIVSAYVLNLAACYAIEKYYFNFIDYKAIMERFGLFLLLNIGISTFVYFLTMKLQITQPVLKLATAFCFYLLALLPLNHFLRLNDTLAISINAVFSRFRNKKLNQ